MVMSIVPSLSYSHPKSLSLTNTWLNTVVHLVAGKWTSSAKTRFLPDPLNGTRFMEVPDTSISEAAPFINSLKVCFFMYPND